MNINYRTSEDSLIPIHNISCVEDVKTFSDFCEVTCHNLFACSPYQLHLDREEFLHFQRLADELKLMLGKEEACWEELRNLCEGLKFTYAKLMHSCWEAFVSNMESWSESGKFMSSQLISVALYNNRVKNAEIP